MALLDDHVAHYMNLDFSKDFISETEHTFHIESPYPLHRPFKNSESDHIEEFLVKAEAFNDKLSIIDSDKITQQIINQDFDGNYFTITKGILQLCKEDVTLTQYKSDYNPFYATGLLQYFKFCNEEYLMRPNIKNQICLTKIKKPSKVYKLTLNEDISDIYGITRSSAEPESLILLRHESSISLLKIEDLSQEVCVTYKKKFKHRLLQSKLKNSNLGCIYGDMKFELYDIGTDKKVNLVDFNDETTNFEFLDSDNNIAFMNENSFKIFDLRFSESQSLKPNLNSCNILTNFKVTENTIYLSSRHFLMRTDLRKMDNVEYCSHLMKSSPCFLEQNNNKQFLVLSSQKYDEKVIFSGDHVNSLPRKVPNLNDSLIKTRLAKDVFFKTDLEERLKLSTAGIQLVDSDHGTDLYSVNCLGDIFKQKIVTDIENLNNSDSIDKFYNWINKLPEPRKVVRVTNLINANNVRVILNQPIKTKKLNQYKRNSKKSTLFLNHYNNIYKKDNLGELASNFASIWDDEEDGIREDVDLVPEVAVYDKVTTWFESMHDFPFD